MKRLQAYPMVVILIAIIGFLLICERYQWPINLLHESECETIDSTYTYAFVLQTEPQPTAQCERYEAEIIGRWQDSTWIAAQGRTLVYIRRDSTRTMPYRNDTIIAQTRLQRGGQLGNFGYGLYLRRQGLIGTAYIYRYSLHEATTHSISLQTRLYQRLQQAELQGKELATTGALTLGYKEDLDSELRQQFQASGAAHVLAVSGLHTGILYAILFGLLTLGKRIRPRYENWQGRCAIGVVIIAAMWTYAWLTGMTPSVVRCVVMITLVEIGRIIHRNSLTINTIAAAAVLILLVRPLDLWSISFQLSFAATTAIVIIATDIQKALPVHRIRNAYLRPCVQWITGTIVVSIAAQLGTLPITMYTFGQLSNYFLLTNLIVLPIATVLVPLGLTTILFGGTGLGQALGIITNGLAAFMNNAVGWIESLPGCWTHIHINAIMVILLYAAIVMGWLTMHKSLWWLIGVIGTMTGFCILFAI